MPHEARETQTLAENLQRAVALHRQGRLAEAERLYRATLAKQPRQFETLRFLGLARLQQGAAEEALALFRAAMEMRPGAPEVLPGLAAALATLSRLEEALSIYEEKGNVISARPYQPSGVVAFDRCITGVLLRAKFPGGPASVETPLVFDAD